ncbi:hypothetical protein ACFPPD_07115 [Cohnella suwonensis]|uniref:DUF4342 domain-containing protein n=1 Tax=Cohnella suwonensis TaxID=696072 RepID=A0ABW0LRF5_9BACL
MSPEKTREQALISRRLDEELKDVKFAKAAETLRRTHPRTRRDRLHAWWNMELRVPLFPIGIGFAVAMTLFVGVRLKEVPAPDETPSYERRELVRAGGNTYWKDEYEKAVAFRDGNTQG